MMTFHISLGHLIVDSLFEKIYLYKYLTYFSYYYYEYFVYYICIREFFEYILYAEWNSDLKRDKKKYYSNVKFKYFEYFSEKIP